jgi:hypothetical protein
MISRTIPIGYERQEKNPEHISGAKRSWSGVAEHRLIRIFVESTGLSGKLLTASQIVR